MGYKLRLGTWNANGLNNKKQLLTHFLHEHDLDVLVINETKLTDNKTFKLNNYNILRRDRPGNRAAGGVIMCIKTDVLYRQMTNVHQNIENIAVKLKDGPTIIGAYNRPNYNYTTHDLDALFNLDRKVILLGDFNAKHDTWNCNRPNINGNTLRTYADDNGLLIKHTDHPTHYPDNGMTPTTIDLVIVKNVTNLTHPESLPQLDSDHNPVTLQLTTEKSFHSTNVPRTYTSYKHTNWTDFRKTLDNNITINNIINTPQDIDREVLLLTNAFLAAKNRHTKTVTVVPDKDVLPPTF